MLAAIPKSPYYFDPYRYHDLVVGNWQIRIDTADVLPIDTTQYGHLFESMILTGRTLHSGQQLTDILPTFS